MFSRVASFLLLFFSLLANTLTAQVDTEVWGEFWDDFSKKSSVHDGDSSYQNQWYKVDSLENLDFTKKAREVTGDIYKQAWADKNYPSAIKAFIYQLKYEEELEEVNPWAILQKIDAEIEKLPSPHKNVLQSIAGSTWLLIENKALLNAFDDEKVEPDTTNPINWSVERKRKRAESYFIQSIQQKEKLLAIDIKHYQALLKVPENGERYQPMLYDVLMWRAHRFYHRYLSTEMFSEVTIPAEIAYADVEEFVKYDFTDSLKNSYKVKAIQILQQLLKRYADKQLTYALVTADMWRIDLMGSFSITDNRDSLAMLWTERQIRKYREHPVVAELYYQLAEEKACIDFYSSYRKYKSPYCDNAKALEYCNLAIDNFPDEPVTERCRELKSQIEQIALEVKTEYTVAPQKPFKFLVTYKNIQQLYLRFIAIDEDSMSSIRSRYNSNKEKELLEALLQYPTIAEKRINLPSDLTYFQNSVEGYYEGLPQGHYAMLVSRKKDFSTDSNIIAYDNFWSTQYAIYMADIGDNKYTYFVSEAENNKPLKNARIVFNYYDYKEDKYKVFADGKTDKNGAYIIEADKNVSVSAVAYYKGKKVVSTKISNYLSYYNRDYNNERTTTHFITDRDLYRPGQTLYFKGVMAEKAHTGEGKLLIGLKEEVELVDVNGDVVAKEVFTTNNFGSFSGSFSLPYGGLTGYYQLKSKHGQISFRVEEYKRPKFEVKLDTIKSNPSFYDTVEVTGKAVAFAGNALNGAKLKFEVNRNKNYIFFNREDYIHEGSTTIKTGTLELDAEGKFAIKFAVIPGADKENNYRYTVEATVTDITGETQSEEIAITVGRRTVYATINIDDEIFSSQKTPIGIKAQNLNREEVPIIGTLQIQEVKVPETIFKSTFWSSPDTQMIDRENYKKLFPNYAYNNEDKRENFALGETVYTQTVSDSSGNALLLWNTSKQESGLYLFTFSYKDNLGKEQKEKRYVALLNGDRKKAFQHEELVVESPRKSYEPGETAEVLISSRFPKTRVVYYLTREDKAGELLHTKLNNSIEKIEIPVTEADRGGIFVTAFAVYNNRLYQSHLQLNIPYTNKSFNMSVSTYRDKMQPDDKEEWELKISGKNAEKISAEIVASMYDASLDKIKRSYWSDFTKSYQQYRYRVVRPEQYTQRKINLQNLVFYTFPEFNIKQQELPEIYFFNWIEDQLHKNYSTFSGWGTLEGVGENAFGGGLGGLGSGINGGGSGGGSLMGFTARGNSYKRKEDNDDMLLESVAVASVAKKDNSNKVNEKSGFDMGLDFSAASFIKIRRNLDETAFFYPHLQTDDSGSIIVKFVAPQALTTWRFRALAHTKDLSSGFASINTITQKPLMVQTNMPRFLREGDEIYISAKIVNLSGKELSPNATLEVYDATTGKNIPEFNNINAVQIPQMASGVSESVKWKFKVPEGYGALKIIVKAYEKNYTDAEANTLPVLSNRILVTEALPISYSGSKSQTYTLKKLTESKTNNTLKTHKLTVEFTSNPAWYAIQALPYMMEYPNECAEQTFNRMYANFLGYYIANSNPLIKDVFESWKATAEKGGGDAFISNLEKNQELKNVLLQETPWLAKGKTESERKRALGRLFDENHMRTELLKAQDKLFEMQLGTGAFPWFSGMQENRAITQYIVAGFGKLNKIAKEENMSQQLERAIKYMAKKAEEEYNKADKKEGESKLSFESIQFLYSISFFPKESHHRTNFMNVMRWRAEAKNHWQTRNLMEKAMLAIALHRLGDRDVAKRIVESFRQTALTSAEQGMYWKQKHGSFNWKDAPIETHCLITEAFSEVAKDTQVVNQARKWLLIQKRLSDWQTTRATADACYALLLNGSDWLATESNVTISVGEKTIDPKTDEEINVEAGTGYIKKSYSGSEVTPSMGKVTVISNEDTKTSMAWGGLYWQYFEQLDKITYAQTPLSIIKQVFIEETTDTGKVKTLLTSDKKLKAGTKLIVRIMLKANKDMEYVHLKDMRAAALEPLENLSGYQWQNGVGYYMSIRDASMNYFFDRLPKGQWVFEYPLVVSQAGTFQNGIATVQNMYAPEFTSHTNGMTITVEP